MVSVRRQSFSQDTCHVHCTAVPPWNSLQRTPWAPPQGKHSWPLVWKQKNEGARAGLCDSVAEHLLSMAGHGFHCQHCKTNKGRQRVETGRNPVFIAVCTVRQRQVNAAVQLLAQCKQMTWFQRSQGQAPALSYEREALHNVICSLDTTLFYKKNKKQEKNKAWPITPTVCGDHLSSEPTV